MIKLFFKIKALKLYALFFTVLFLLSLSGNGQVKHSKHTITEDSEEASVQTIRKIFREFIKYEEGIDSYENKDALKKALRSLPATINPNELPLLINVWMYYDATDFPTRDLISPIFLRNKKTTLIAIKKRLAYKKKWESNDTAPYSDLIQLEKDLQ